MVQSTSVASLMAIAMFASVNGHMLMKTPHPYGPDTLNNSPLDASGSDFPCKLRGDATWADPVAENVFAIGESQTLSFTGSAVHGGGSCQISLTTDKQPTASSKWQVIHSIEGGCPASAAGNLPEDANGSGASQFQFKIPDGISTGEYTLAWTWFNKIGNREMYMNCAPITVTAAKKRRYAPSPPALSKRETSFPDMAVANLKSINTCETVENTDVVFPDPGSSLETVGSPTGAFIGDGCPLAGGSSGSSSGSGSSGSGASSVATATSSATAITQSTGGVFATPVVSSAVSSAPAQSPTAAASADPVASPAASTSVQSAPAPSSTSTGNSSTGSATQGASCTSEGSAECAADGQSYMICASGYWQSMPVAAGTECSGTGIQANVNIVATNAKVRRHAHVQEHVRRHRLS